MKFRKLFAVLGMSLLLFSESLIVKADPVSWPQGPGVDSESAIVMDADTGAILYAKNIDDQHYPASITKVLTALVALENNELTDIVTVQYEDISFLEYGDAHIGLKVGEEITMEDALYAVLLESANEAAHAVASNTEGGYENFLKLMNDKAKELGCKNSNFTNTNGLHDENHYTSARDMALIASAAFQNDTFMEITGTMTHKIPTTNLTDVERWATQNHKMRIDWEQHYFEYCVGGKTGYTDQARNTLVSLVEKDGTRLVSVVMRAPGNQYAYTNSRAILDYALENFSKTPVTLEMVGDEEIQSLDKNAYVILPGDVSFEDLTCEKQNGQLIYYYGERTVGKIDFTEVEPEPEIEDSPSGQSNKKTEKKDSGGFKSTMAKIGRVLLTVFLVIVGLAVAGYLFLAGYAVYRRKQRKKRRAEMRKKKRDSEYRRYLKEMDEQK